MPQLEMHRERMCHKQIKEHHKEITLEMGGYSITHGLNFQVQEVEYLWRMQITDHQLHLHLDHSHFPLVTLSLHLDWNLVTKMNLLI